jgi:hypothetical protein
MIYSWNYLKEYSSQHIDIAYGYYSSVNEELEKNLTGDITLFGGTMALMIVYAFAATFSSRYFISLLLDLSRGSNNDGYISLYMYINVSVYCAIMYIILFK